MSQLSFSDAEYLGKRKRTRREVFLSQMEQVVPWSALVGLIEPHYPKAGRGRRPYALETMLRIYLLQQWYGLSDPAMEEALYEITSMRQFARVSLNRPIPDETTLLHFRHLLEQHGLCARLFEAVSGYLQEKGLWMRHGTIVDATIIAAPSSTKNKAGERDREMHQTKKGNQWYFGMKAHIGVDAESGLVHTVVGTAANVADVTQTGQLLHGDEQVAYGDAGFIGAGKRAELKERKLEWNIARRRSQVEVIADEGKRELARLYEHLIAKVRAKVEHPFGVIKRQFGHVKVRYRGLAKNTAQLHVLFALSNLWMVRKRLLALTGQVRPLAG